MMLAAQVLLRILMKNTHHFVNIKTGKARKNIEVLSKRPCYGFQTAFVYYFSIYKFMDFFHSSLNLLRLILSDFEKVFIFLIGSHCLHLNIAFYHPLKKKNFRTFLNFSGSFRSLEIFNFFFSQAS